MPENERLYYEKPDLKHEALKTWAPQNESQYLGGMLMLIIGALVGLWMFFNYKSKSPATQARAEFNEKYADLDKRVSLNEQQTNNIEMNINQQFLGMHNRLGKIEESMLLLAQSYRTDNKS